MIDETMPNSRYFIKKGYVENPVISFDRKEQESYWSAGNFSGAPYYQRPVYDFARSLIQQHRYQTVIDVGCGSGHKLSELQRQCPTVDFIGVDQESAVHYCERTYSFGQWIAANLDEPFATRVSQRADLIICSDVIEHLATPEILLMALKTLVKPEGQIILSTPNRDRVRGTAASMPANKFHVREWNDAEFQALLTHYGYEIIRHFHVLPVNMAWNMLTWNLIVKRALQGKPIFYNQVALLRPIA